MINENFLFYKTTSGELKSINLEDVTLLRYTSKDSSIITLDQTGSAGFYIQPKDWFYKGTYQTTLNWSLSDVPTE